MTTSKKYPQQEEEQSSSSFVREPAAAYGANINDLKLEMMQRVMDIQSPRSLKKLLSFAETLIEEPEQAAMPCQFTAEEMNVLLDRAETDIKAGNTMSADEMKRRVLNKYLQ